MNLTVANANQWKGKILEVHCSKNVQKFKSKSIIFSTLPEILTKRIGALRTAKVGCCNTVHISSMSIL